MEFNPNIPNNSLPLIFEESLKNISQNVDVIKFVNNSNKSLFKLEKSINSMPRPEILLDFISIPESIDSSSIENIHTTIDEAFQAEIMWNKIKVTQPTKETLHYKEALLYWFYKIKDRWWLNLTDIKKINSIIVWYESDFYSSPSKKIINSKNEVLYTPPQWIDNINKLMENFCWYFNKRELIIWGQEEDKLLLAPILHYQFEAIHPFMDGNWRTGRILLVLYLVLQWILSYPILFLSEYIHREKSLYYNNLRNMDKYRWSSNSLEELTKFIILIMEVQWIITDITVLKIQQLQIEIEMVVWKKTNIKNLKEIIDVLFSQPFHSVEDFSMKLWIHRNTSSNYLNQLVKIWVLGEKKIWRNKLFVFLKYLDILKDR